SQRSSSASSGCRITVAAVTITVYPPVKASRCRTVPPRSITPIAMTPPSTSIVTTASPKKARRPAEVMPEGYEIPCRGHDGASTRSSRGFPAGAEGSPDGAEESPSEPRDPRRARRRRGAGPPHLGAHGSRLLAHEVTHGVRASGACGRTSRTLPDAASGTSVRRSRRRAGSRTTRGGRMLHERRLTALDSSAPLLFIEAIPGSGKRAMLRRWEDGGGSRRGELRLLFDVRQLPAEPANRARMFWMALRHRLERDLPDLPADDALLEDAVVRGLRQLRRPVAVAFLGGDQIDETDVDLRGRLLEAGSRLIVAGFDLSRVQDLARQRGIYSSTLGDRETWLTLGEVRILVRGQGAALSEDAVDALYNATLGHPGMILASLEAMPVEAAAGLVTRDRALAAFLSGEALDQARPGFAEFLAVAARLPRF